ncbi:hypothetical protein [Acrocarpospora pleiomorpha]|nr:hypothetical protein [Acrocarpospora pleiomorpha]
MGTIVPGVPKVEVLAHVGEFDWCQEQRGPDPYVCLAGDVEFCFTTADILFYIAVEPPYPVARLAMGESGRTPSGTEFTRLLLDRGETLEECTPYTDSQIWLRILGSGVLIDITEEDRINCIMVSLPELPAGG